MSQINNWIAENVKDLTFCDIGGIGINSQNERASLAINAGAIEATMIDYRKFGFPEWDVFDQKMKKEGIANVKKIDNVNLEAASFPADVGMYDFVHCTGILYHAPSPMSMLQNLSKITRKYLIVNTVIVPEVINNSKGKLDFSGSKTLFLPGISDREREILEDHYQRILGWPAGKFSSFAPKVSDPNAPMPYLQHRAKDERYFWGDKGDLSYTPYWTLFSKPAFRAAVEMFGFKIIKEQSFKSHTLGVLCERT